MAQQVDVTLPVIKRSFNKHTGIPCWKVTKLVERTTGVIKGQQFSVTVDLDEDLEKLKARNPGVEVME